MIRPLTETVDEREFTNRGDELAFLWRQVERAKNGLASSYAIIARKGMGKTALLRRFYNDLFIQQEEVIPFYISFGEFQAEEHQHSLSLTAFIRYYFETLARQYLAFKLRQSELVEQEKTNISDLKSLLSASAATRETEQAFLLELEAYEALWMDKDLDKLLRYVILFTRNFLNRSEQRGLLMIDEFQLLTNVWDERTRSYWSLANIYQGAAEARWCPLIVTGSAVSLITKTVMGGLLTRRFGPYDLRPFTPEYSVEYAAKLAALNNIPLREGVAYAIHTLTGGNPHYIWCLLNSEAVTEAGFASLDHLYRVYEFEMNSLRGKLRGFWNDHFLDYTDKINSSGIAMRLLHHLATLPEDSQTINLNDAADHFEVDLRQVLRVMQDLRKADLVEAFSSHLYYRISDPVLADYIRREYQVTLEKRSLSEFMQNFESEIRRKMGSLNNAVGRAAELFTIGLMSRFNGQKVDSLICFGLPGERYLPHFQAIDNRSGLIIEGDRIEFDVAAEGETETWLVEVRHRKKPLDAGMVKAFQRKVEQWEGETSPLLWLLSFSGFTKSARQRLKELGIHHSDRQGFNRLADAVGYAHFPDIQE